MNMTRAQKKMAKDRATTVAVICFLIAGCFGWIAKHFLLGSGFFAGIEVNTTLWGCFALVIAIIAGFIMSICFGRAIILQEPEGV